YEHTGAFCPDQRSRHIEVILRQQLIQGVSRNPPRNSGVPLPNEIGIFVADPFQSAVDLPAAAAFSDGGSKFKLTGRADVQPQPVVSKDFKAFNVLERPAAH